MVEITKVNHSQNLLAATQEVLCVWWTCNSMSPSRKVRQIHDGFNYIGTPAKFTCLLDRHPNMSCLLKHTESLTHDELLRTLCLHSIPPGNSQVSADGSATLHPIFNITTKRAIKSLDPNLCALLNKLSQAFQTHDLLTPLANGLHLSPEHLDLAVHVEEDIGFLHYGDCTAFSLMVHWMVTCEDEDAVKLVYLHEAFAHCGQLQFCDDTMISLGHHLYCCPYGEFVEDSSSNPPSDNDDDEYSTPPEHDAATPIGNGEIEEINSDSDETESEADSLPQLCDIKEGSEEQPIVIDNDDDNNEQTLPGPLPFKELNKIMKTNRIKAVPTGAKTVFHIAPGHFNQKQVEKPPETQFWMSPHVVFLGSTYSPVW